MGLFDALKKEVDKIVNPYEHETPIQREERHRREDKKHELEMQKAKNTKHLIRPEHNSSKLEDTLFNDWDKF
jgi:hypothetical protein